MNTLHLKIPSNAMHRYDNYSTGHFGMRKSFGKIEFEPDKSSSEESSVNTIVNQSLQKALTYTAYYIGNLLTNVFITSLYIVQVFSNHEACRTRSGFNVTMRYDIAFRLGFIIIAAEISNTNLFGIYIRFIKKREETSLGYNHQMKIILT